MLREGVRTKPSHAFGNKIPLQPFSHEIIFIKHIFLMPTSRCQNIFRVVFTYERLAECTCCFYFQRYTFPHTGLHRGTVQPQASVYHCDKVQPPRGGKHVWRFALWRLPVVYSSLNLQQTVHRLCTQCSVYSRLNRGNLHKVNTFCNLASQLDRFPTWKAPIQIIFCV